MTPLLLLAAVGQAISPPPQDRGPEIVVRAPEQSAGRTIEQLTKAITPAMDDGYARQTAPLCVKVSGFLDDAGSAITRRIEEDAAAAGFPASKPGCTPNLVVMLVADGRTLVREALRRRPWLFAEVTPLQQAALAAERGPVRAWSTVRVSGADGDPLQPGADQGPPTVMVGMISRTRLTVRHDIAGTTILVDKAAVPGKSVEQLADYCAVRALANASPPAGQSERTILALFAGGTPAPRLTAFDLAYLKALYHGPANYHYSEKVSSMAQDIQHALAPVP